jgi:ketosteroid isomerase-like protein
MAREAFAENSNNERVLRHHETVEERAVAQDNRQTLIKAIEALGQGDAESFWAIFDSDVVFHEAPCLPYGGAHEGIEATRRAYAHLSSVFAGLRAEFEAILAARDLVILQQNVTFATRDRGHIGTMPVAEMFRFRDGKVIEWRAHYFDSNMVAKAFEAA